MQEGKSMNKRSISVTFILNLVKRLRIQNKVLIISRISQTISVYSDKKEFFSSYLDFSIINVFRNENKNMKEGHTMFQTAICLRNIIFMLPYVHIF